MADGRGGYRRPTNPAQVSGPGALSRRTDGQPVMDLPDARYGENKEFTAVEAGAPMASQPPVTGGGGGPALDLSQLVGLGEPSLSDEPVTAGAAAGAGPGLEVLGARTPVQADSEFLRKYWPVLAKAAQREDAAPSLKKFARLLFTQM